MQQRIKPSSHLMSLVMDFETMLKNGKEDYLAEKSYIELIYFFQDNFECEKALCATERAIVRYPYLIDFYLIKVRLLIQSGDLRTAQKTVDTALGYHPNDRELLLLSSMICSKSKDFSEAFRLLDALNDQSVGDEEVAEILVHESHVYESMKDYDSMYRTLSRALELDPGRRDALERIWLATELAKKHRDSLKLHTRLTNRDPYNALAWYNLGHSYAYLNIYRRAIDALEYAFLIDPDFELAYRDCAELCIETRRFSRALSILIEHQDRFGIDNEVLVNLGVCYFRLHQTDKAIAILKRATKLDPYDDEAFYNLGKCFVQSKQWDKALRCFLKAISIDDKCEEYFAGLAQCYFAKSDFVKANYYFSKATELGPELDEHWLNHVRFLIKIGENEEALQVLQEAESNTVSPEFYYCKANCLLKLGHRKEGMAILEQGLKERYDLHQCLFEMGPEFKCDPDIKSMIRFYQK